MRRSDLRIFFDVLRAIERGTRKPTRIMYRSNVCRNRITLILDHMVREGLVAIQLEPKMKRVRRLYALTPKGLEAIQHLAGALELERKVIGWKRMEDPRRDEQESCEHA